MLCCSFSQYQRLWSSGLHSGCRSRGVQPWVGSGDPQLGFPWGSTLLAARRTREHLTLPRAHFGPDQVCLQAGSCTLGGFGAPWQRVQFIPVACLFLGNRKAGIRTHLL